jgi:hypothetical protein
VANAASNPSTNSSLRRCVSATCTACAQSAQTQCSAQTTHMVLFFLRVSDKPRVPAFGQVVFQQVDVAENRP